LSKSENIEVNIEIMGYEMMEDFWMTIAMETEYVVMSYNKIKRYI